MKDKRYTIAAEYAGHARKRHVVRFCGEFVSSHVTKPEAETARVEYKKQREQSA